MLPPPGRVVRENGAARGVGARAHMSVPRVEPGPGDHGGQPDGLLGVPQCRGHGVLQPFQSLQQLGRLVAVDVERSPGNRQGRDDQRPAASVKLLDERHGPGVPARDLDEDADVEDPRRRDGPDVLAHRYRCDGGSCAAWASTCAIIRSTWAMSAWAVSSFHRLAMRLSRSTRSVSASLTTADTDGALPDSTRRSAYAARCGSIVTVTRIFRSLIPGSYD